MLNHKDDGVIDEHHMSLPFSPHSVPRFRQEKISCLIYRLLGFSRCAGHVDAKGHGAEGSEMDDFEDQCRQQFRRTFFSDTQRAVWNFNMKARQRRRRKQAEELAARIARGETATLIAFPKPKPKP